MRRSVHGSLQAYGSISPCPDSGGYIPLFHLPSPSMPYSPPVLRKQIHTLLLIIVSEGCFLCRSLPIRMRDSPSDPFYPPPDVFRNTPALLQITGSQLSIYCEWKHLTYLLYSVKVYLQIFSVLSFSWNILASRESCIMLCQKGTLMFRK